MGFRVEISRMERWSFVRSLRWMDGVFAKVAVGAAEEYLKEAVSRGMDHLGVGNRSVNGKACEVISI